MKLKKHQLYCLETNISTALAKLDPKGTDTKISQAMSIVRMAFSQAFAPRLSPCNLHERACEMHPTQTPLPQRRNP